jgi:DUF1680 family protein
MMNVNALKRAWSLTISAMAISATSLAQPAPTQLLPINFSQVRIQDAFWNPQITKVANQTLDACILYTEEKTGRIRNFDKVAAGGGTHEGIYYDDSDVYKALEAIGYAVADRSNPKLEEVADRWIDKIAAAQLPDGYLNTFYTLTDINQRWTDMERHEAYCAGHLIEAGIAYANSTGKTKLLDVGIRFANHMDSTFRLANRPWVTGHQELELALVKLYHHTKDKRYVAFADWLLEQRGHGHGVGKIWDDWKTPEYAQDHIPVREQRKIEGHAVRAMYLYAGVADVAAITGDQGYINTMHHIWDDVINNHYYITGGIGAQGSNEGFGKPKALPNETAYCETCASVGMVFWNQRMNSLWAHAKYIDVLERTLYNAAIDGINLNGDRFFYGNVLASSGQHERREWFGTACCPSNIARLITSLGSYIYSRSTEGLYVNLFIGSETRLPVAGTNVAIKQRTGYPWKGDVHLEINPDKRKEFAVYVRIPGWLNEPVPGDLYSYQQPTRTQYRLLVNGEAIDAPVKDGYAVIKRQWRKGDQVSLDLDMQVQRIQSHPDLKENENKIALQYGPIVYAIEDIDVPHAKNGLFVPQNTTFQVSYEPQLLGGVNMIQFEAPIVALDPNSGLVSTQKQKVKAIPYYTWNNRGKSPMMVWMPEKVTEIKIQ